MNKSRQCYTSAFLLCFLVFLPGCTSVHQPSGFLEDYDGLGRGEYFRQEYVKPEVDFSKYQKVKVNPV